jgi:hypothetical protein
LTAAAIFPEEEEESQNTHHETKTEITAAVSCM